MRVMRLLFSPAGRATRRQFWVVQICYVAVLVLAVWLDPDLFDDQRSVLAFSNIGFDVIALSAVWSGLCLGIKRFHDRDKDAFWMLVLLLPYIGELWYLVEVGFLPGTDGPNRFGDA